MKRKNVSVARAIGLAERSVEKWKEAEQRGKASGMSAARQRIVDELKDFRKDLKKNKDNELYVCRTASGYVDALQNQLFHAKLILAYDADAKIVAEARKRLDKVYQELTPLVYLLEGIDIEA